MSVSVVDPTKDARWDAFVATHPDATVYHTTTWAQVLVATYGYQPRYLVLEDATGRIRAGLPLLLVRSWLTGRRLVCLPFSDECWPLVTSTDDASLLLEAAREMLTEEKVPYVEIRGQASDGSLVRTLDFIPRNYYKLHVLSLGPDLEKLRSQFHHNTARSVRKSEKMGVIVEEVNDLGSFRRFYRLNLITRRKHGAPPQPWLWFRNLNRFLVAEGMVHLFLARWNREMAAGAIFLTHKDDIYYKYGASDPRFLKCRPNHAIFWEVIQWGSAHGYRRLNFGRSDPDQTGLLDFKRCWGAEEVELPYYYYPAVQGVGATEGSSAKLRAMRAVFRRLPASLLEWAGAVLYRHLG